MTIKITMDRKGQTFIEGIRREIPRQSPRYVALFAGRVVRRIQAEVRDEFNKDSRGKLAKSFMVRVRKKPPSASIISTSPYAVIHDRGGTITPKRATALTVPLTEQAKRWPARASAWRNLFRVPGTNVLATKSGNSISPQFVLKKAVQIKAKRYIQKAHRKSLPDAEKTFRQMAVAIVQAARRKARR
jgi:hypothetical protein